MPPQTVFITGATGYIGGSVLEALHKRFPELEITALLRKPTPEFKEHYLKVKIVIGTFDDADVIQAAAEKADIVIHTGDIDHEGCAKAILAGLAKKTTPGYLIHLTGTGCISDVYERGGDGTENPFVWDDIRDSEKIYALPDTNMHHAIDRAIMDASNDVVKTITICPPDIYGQTTGITSRGTFMVPKYVELLLKSEEAFYLGEGQNFRAITHISDVVSLFVLVTEEIVLRSGNHLTWGREGFYFAVADEVKWKDAAEAIHRNGIEKGWLSKEAKVVSWDLNKLQSVVPGMFAPYIWGSNSRAVSSRAAKLGWKPSGPTFWDVLEEDVALALKACKK